MGGRICVLIVSGRDDIVWETTTHGHALLLVDQQRVLLYFNVLLQPLLVPQQVLERVAAFIKLVLQQLDATGDLGHLLDQLVVGLVVAGLHVRASGSLLQAGLGNAKRRVLGTDVALQAFDVALLFGYFLKFGID